MSRFRETISVFFQDYIRIIFMILGIILLTRTFEYAYLYSQHNPHLSAELFFSRSLNYDTLVLMLCSIILVVPMSLLSLIHTKTAAVLIRIFALLFVFGNLALTHYFLTNQSVLNSFVFQFSMSDLFTIAANEFTMERAGLWIADFLILAATTYLLFFLPRSRKQTSTRSRMILFCTYCVLAFLSLANVRFTFKSLNYFKTNFEYLLGNNKYMFMYRSITNTDTYNEYLGFRKEVVLTSAQEFQKANPDFHYTSQEYPLIHDEPYKNVLGPFFREDTIHPNVVIIICESLSSSFCGPGSAFGNLTPFANNLIKQGLYWENFLSNADRTFGALPNILASLPFGYNSRGFINAGEKDSKDYPDHTSLIRLLKLNGYSTHFYYGGWGYFDKTSFFLESDGIDQIITESDFDTSLFKLGMNGDKTKEDVWGYNDMDMFDQSLRTMDKYKPEGPYLNIYQTLSFHSPFNLIKKEYASSEFLNKRMKEAGVSDSIRKYMAPEMIASLIFADDALKDFMQQSAKRGEYQNTIFIITGDHAIPFHIQDDMIEEYRIPLIIWSPLLKATRKFKGVCSHIDILPSLLGLLQDNYGQSFPETKHWIGYGLDTSTEFRTQRFVPLNIFNRDGARFLFRDELICADQVYKITRDKKFVPADTSIVNSAASLFRHYMILNRYVCQENKIWKP